LAIIMIAFLAFLLSMLQGRFDSTDVKKAISLAMAWKPNGGQTVFDAMAARGEGDPGCDGHVVSQLLGDVEVRCSTPKAPQTEYQFRVLLDGKRPPRAANPAADDLVKALAGK
jgi:hypothetical protein